jgi:DNA (cytosine-5)-methyltransferase 1
MTHYANTDFVNVQSFPQDYDFCDQQAQYICGMSVPPVMMAQVASEVYRQWLK